MARLTTSDNPASVNCRSSWSGRQKEKRLLSCRLVVHFYNTHSVDIDGELAQLDTHGYRPLRLAMATSARR